MSGPEPEWRPGLMEQEIYLNNRRTCNPDAPVASGFSLYLNIDVIFAAEGENMEKLE